MQLPPLPPLPSQPHSFVRIALGLLELEQQQTMAMLRRHSDKADRGVMVGLSRAGVYADADAIANHPEVHYSGRTVSRWVQRYANEGYEGLNTRPRSGRPKVITVEEELLIQATTLARPFDSVKEIVRELAPHLMDHLKTVYAR